MQPFNLLKYVVIYVVAVNVSFPPDGFFDVGKKVVFTSRRILHNVHNAASKWMQITKFKAGKANRRARH